MIKKTLIYDGGCAYCRAFAALLKQLDRCRRFETFEYDSPQAQALLKAQFGEKYGFTMYLFEFDAGEVSWGAEAARRVVESLKMPQLLAKLVFFVYPALVRLVSRLTRRRRPVCGPECAGSTAQGRVQSAGLQEKARRLALRQPS
jgi:predicted DCC family thiol-disulfide oxidoreductase YuxK